MDRFLRAGGGGARPPARATGVARTPHVTRNPAALPDRGVPAGVRGRTAAGLPPQQRAVTARPMSGQPAFIATCSRGLEPILEDELRELGLPRVRSLRGAVLFGATLADGYRALMWSRCASRVLAELTRFPCADADALYDGARAVDWLDHLDPDKTFAVDFVGRSSQIRHSKFGAYRVKDAIVDTFMDRLGRRPDVDAKEPDLRLHAHLNRNQVTLAVDLAGVPLHERGLSRTALEAPVKETLAASLLRIAGWHRDTTRPLVDPMCGSGTFLLEAGMLARDFAPGLARERWGFDGWKQHDPGLWKAQLDEAVERGAAGADRPVALYGSDRDGLALQATHQNLVAADLDDTVKLARRDVSDAHAPEGEGPGLVVTNPPYGTRLGTQDEAARVMRDLGHALRRRFLGWTAWILVGSPQQARALGLRPAARHEVRTGPLDARFLEVPIADRAPEGDRPGWSS